MFLTVSKRGYNRHDEQFTHGRFLIIFQDPAGDSRPWTNAEGKVVKVPELRCLVRHVRLRQCGYWMMGSVQIGPHRFSLSGDYGADGLPIHLPHLYNFSKGAGGRRSLTEDEQRALWDSFHPIPDDLQDEFWSGGGHNEGGAERSGLRAWARPQVRALRKRRRV
jgi:hypothetical protein